MKHPLDHTFVILAYKTSAYLEDCILSLMAQTVKSRIIIATSTPCTFIHNIAQKYDIPVIINENSTGMASDWTLALNYPDTRYVTLAHQDDVYLPDYACKSIEKAQHFPSSIITFSDYMELRDESLQRNNMLLMVKRLILFFFYTFKNNLSSAVVTRFLLSCGNPVCCPSIMYNMKNIGYLTFNDDFVMNTDWEATLRLARMPGDFIYVNQKLMLRRIHGDSETTHALTTRKRQEEDLIMFSTLLPGWARKVVSRMYAAGYKYNG